MAVTRCICMWSCAMFCGMLLPLTDVVTKGDAVSSYPNPFVLVRAA